MAAKMAATMAASMAESPANNDNRKGRAGAGPMISKSASKNGGEIAVEDQEALDLAADWSDISQGLRKDLGQQLHSQWIRPIQLGSFCKETGTLDLFLPTEFSANWVA